MATPTTSVFPLGKVSDFQARLLCQALWAWGEPCARCWKHDQCLEPSCPWSRLPRLGPFFQHYKELTASYIPYSIIPGALRSIRSHEDVFDIIGYLQDHPTTKRLDLTTQYFAQRDTEDPPEIDDQHRAFNLAASVMLMMTCSVDGQTGGLLESGTTPSVWRKDQSIIDFIASTFPTRDHPTLNDGGPEYLDIKASLKATRLKKIARLKFVGTDDIRHHLELDQKTGIVKIFHHTSVLKENLEALNQRSQRPVTTLMNALPEQLLVETLDSIQTVLFPLDLESQALLRSLVSKESFDPDCGRLRSTSQSTSEGDTVRYQYWGSRLMDLYDEIENPKARGILDTWLEQRSKARHAMLAALVGVAIAIVLGLLTLVVAIIQTYIAWQAWKHPVLDGV